MPMQILQSPNQFNPDTGLAFFKSCLDTSVLVKFPFQPCIVVTALVRCSCVCQTPSTRE